jgi:hypothetical protein
LAVIPCLLLSAGTSFGGGFTETLPKSTFMLEANYTQSWVNGAFNNNGDMGPLVDRIERYEPGGGQQGILIPNVEVSYMFLITQLQYGIIDELSVALAFPVAIKTTVNPKFSWIPGDYQPHLGRRYSQKDFWDWAASMGQPEPTTWEGNNWTLSDIVLGARWRFTDRFSRQLKDTGFAGALTISGVIPTGSNADPEEVLAAGTSMWDLNAQGELNFHVGFDKSFKKELDDRLTIGVELFYEMFFSHTYVTPTGAKNPLLCNYAPYVGPTYQIDPGDFMGASAQFDVVPVKGPALASWISGNDKARAEKFPPMLTFAFRYTFTYLQQTYYTSPSDLWNYDREKQWRPGYKNALFFKLQFSFLRLGAPLMIYATYRNLSWIPGKNTRASDTMAVGIQIPLKFW